MAGQDPREAWRKIQMELQQRTKGFGGGGGPKMGAGVAGIALLVGGVWAANNALFNGSFSLPSAVARWAC